jgi:transcriptional regulator with XRE-family HTH domain
MDLPDLTERLGDYMRILRRRADASQREMAKLTGTSTATIGGLESGRITDVRLRTFARLAGAGGCRIVLIDDDSGGFVEPYPGIVPLLDAADRRLPAHLDPRPWIQPSHWTPPHGPLTFYRDRGQRDRWRAE